MKNQVDIIIPVFNSQKFISKTLDSVFRQTFKNWKLIIIDDASTDNTRKIVERICVKIKDKTKIMILRNNINKGQAFSRNRGLKHSKSKFVTFLDSDDYWDKNKLKKQIKFMLSNNYDFTYTDYKIIKNNQIKKITVPNSYSYNSFIYNSSINTCSMVLKKKIIKKIYFKNLRFSEDYFFKCQILRKGYIAYKSPGSYAYYLLRNGSLQSNRLSVFSSLWSINKNFNKMSFIQNFTSVFFIIVNSLKKYGFR
jgi:teichuronic acid biosynthesis glycosyltransferase TuaG